MKPGVYKRLSDGEMFRALGTAWWRQEQLVVIFPQHGSTRGLILVAMDEFEKGFEFITTG